MKDTLLKDIFTDFPLNSIVKGFVDYGLGTLRQVDDVCLLSVPGFVLCSRYNAKLEETLNSVADGTSIVFSNDSDFDLASKSLSGFSEYMRSALQINGAVTEVVKPSPYTFRKIDLETDLDNIIDQFGYHFYLLSEYKKCNLGFGFLAEQGNTIVGVVSTYTVSKTDCEIQIDVLAECRNQGVASYLTSLFVNACIEREIEPKWDAANYRSRALGEKLGFDLKRNFNCLVKGMAPDVKLKSGLA